MNTDGKGLWPLIFMTVKGGETMGNLICFFVGMLCGTAMLIVVTVLILDAKEKKGPPTKDEWKQM